MDTHTPKHRDDSRAAYFDSDLRSLAADPPPVHPDGLVVGRHRLSALSFVVELPAESLAELQRGREIDRALRRYHRASGRPESGSTTLAAATAFWMVAGLLGVLAGFAHLVGCVA